MKAYILEEKGKAGFKDIPLPEIKSYEALVRTTVVANCRIEFKCPLVINSRSLTYYNKIIKIIH